MKFGETGDSIHAYSFSVQEGYSTPAWPFDKTVKILKAIDGTIIDTINFGARQHRTAEFNVNYMTRAEHYALQTYFSANKGLKIRLELENTGERVFGEQYTGTVYYAYLLDADSMGETQYTPSHTMYGFSLKLDFAGTASNSVPNPVDSSDYDFLITIDCVRVTLGCQVANKAALDAITNKPGGSRGLTTDNRKVYFWNAALSAWQFQYTAPANDPAQGLKNGVFRLSAFADITGSSAGISAALGSAEDFKSGWIVEKSIKFPRYSVDARQGPAVEHPEGFAFALDNSNKRWKYPLDNNLAFYGAYCQIYAYDRLSGQLVLMRSGFNNKNGFDYTRLDFEVEPGVFLQNKSFPVAVIDKASYPNAAESMRGKPVLATYGRWDKGLLQTVAFNLDPVRFGNGKKLLDLTSWDNNTKVMVVDLDPGEVSRTLGYAFGTYPATLSKHLYASIYAQPDQNDLKKLRKVLVCADAAGKLQMTLENGFSEPVTTAAKIVIYLSNIEILIDSTPVVGMRKSNYILKGSSDTETKQLELYGLAEGVLSRINGSAFSVLSGENKITLDANKISVENAGEIIQNESEPLTVVKPTKLHRIVDKTHANGYTYFDFGLSPDGVKSNEVLLAPIERVTQGQSKLLAAFSKTFTTLAWTKFDGATGYRLFRIKWEGVYPYLYNGGFDLTFGAGPGVKLKNDSIVYGVAGVVSLSGGVAGVNDGDAFVAIDLQVDQTSAYTYTYLLEPIANGQLQQVISSANGQNRPVPAGTKALKAFGKNSAIVLVWPVPDLQATYKVDVDGAASASISNATKGWHEITGLTNNQGYKVTVSVNTLNIGNGGDTWFMPAGTSDGVGFHQLLKSGGSYAALPYLTLRDNPNADLQDDSDLSYVRNWGAVIKKRYDDGSDLPPAAVVFSWLWSIEKTPLSLGNLAGAKNVRVLANFSVRSWVGVNAPIPFIITMKGVKADKSVSFTLQYENMTAKAPPEGGSRGAYARFENLRKAQSGLDSETNYDTENVTPNAEGLYTGKDMWTLPDWLFEDGAYEWSQVEYILFSITNAAPIAFADISGRSTGYHLGLGGPPGATWTQVKHHKPNLYIEYTRQFDGGLSQPLYARIDGGRIDDSAGTITGTPNKIIEKARHVVDHVVNEMLGFKPIYLSNEMKSRDGWLWRWQAAESKPLLETLQMLAKNIHGIWVLTPDDKLYLRSLDINDSSIPSVYSFSDSNIIVDSLGKPEYRRRNEIYQRFRLKYNIEPSKDAKPTEEMLIGWDLATSKPVLSGYQTVVEDAAGLLELIGDSMADGLADPLCRLSTQLYAAGLGLNEFGAGENAERVYEMFYRPTTPSKLTGEPVERDLPNLSALYGVNVKPPKMAMQVLAKMVVNFFCYDSWYFSLSISMKNLIYNPAIAGVKDEAGTPDRRLKLGDVVTVTSDFHTAGKPVRCIILDIEPKFYDGVATIRVFAPRPPGQLGTFVDPVWDAGAPGPRNEADFVFKGSLYGLLSEDGTFADAGGIGSRNETTMKFPDGTFADPKGSGAGKA